MKLTKTARRLRIQRRIRRIVSGTADCPRLSVFRSNSEIYVQAIDDTTGTTLSNADSRDKSLKELRTGKTKVELSGLVGKLIATRLKEKGIAKVVFDRGGYLYHGRVKGLAEGAREGGLIF